MTKEKIREIEALVADALECHALPYPPVDVERMCGHEGIALLPSDYHDSFDSRIEYHRSKGKFLLFLDTGDRGRTEGRRRFSIAHELGHFYLPDHRQALLDGVTHYSDTETFSPSVATEAEADEFAARLLMPTKVFGKTMKDVSVDELHRLARMFETSLTATAHRMVQEAFKTCSVVLSDGRRVRYAKHSESSRMSYLYGIHKGDPVPKMSRTAAFANTGKLEKETAVIPADYWYKSLQGRGRVDERIVWEEVGSLGQYGYVTFLVCEE
ncbi:MAG: ImmA/IrrE family metallo-endopeptidase [Planctomycetota bacterium]